jgi:nucleoside phosphorylase
MKNLCFIGAMSAELIYLENLLGEEKTSYKIMKENKIIEVPEENVLFRPSKKLGLTVIHTYDKETNLQIMVQNDYKNNVSVINSGVGLNNAYCAAKMINQKKYEHIINIGTAGALDEELECGDIISVDNVLIKNAEESENKNENFFYLDMRHFKNFKKGGVFSSQEFLDNKKKKYYCNKFNEINLGIKAVDMELFALRQVIPDLISLKIISDKVNENNETFMSNFSYFVKTKYNAAINCILETINS